MPQDNQPWLGTLCSVLGTLTNDKLKRRNWVPIVPESDILGTKSKISAFRWLLEPAGCNHRVENFQEGRFLPPIRKPFQGPQLLQKDDPSNIPAVAPQLFFQTLWTANNSTFGFRSERKDCICRATFPWHHARCCSLGPPLPARDSGIDTAGLLGTQSFQSGASEKNLREMNPQLRLKIGRICRKKLEWASQAEGTA